MELTLTAKLMLRPTPEQALILLETGRAFSKACNYVSDVVFDTHNLNQFKLQDETYRTLRSEYNMPSQMAINVIRHVIGNYKTIRANQGEWIKPSYKHTTYPLTWNRDYLLRQGWFSIGTLHGRLKLSYETGGMEKYFDGSWSFGAAKVVCKHGKWYLHVSMTKDMDVLQQGSVSNVVAVDPKYTSQTCPKCGHTAKSNRNRKHHLFCCKSCGYQSNDDRIGAMNLHRKGIEYLSAVAGG